MFLENLKEEGKKVHINAFVSNVSEKIPFKNVSFLWMIQGANTKLLGGKSFD